MDPSRIVIKAATGIIWMYQVLTIGLAPRCRFYPSCSAYARDSLESRGLSKVLGLTVVRLLKCHPFHPGGYDPVSTH